MKVACNSIFMSIFIGRVIMNPHNFLRKCFYKFDSQNWWFSILKSESYWMRTLQPLTPLGLSAERAASHFIYYIHVSLILDWTVFGRCSLDKMLILHYFFYTTPVITVSASFWSYSVEWQCKSIDWFLYHLDAVIEVYSSYLIHFLFIY